MRDIEADGPIDVLVNNAGVDLTGDLVDLADDEIALLVAVNLCAPMLLCRAVIPGMQRRGRGHIVNVSSLAGTNAIRGLAPYSRVEGGTESLHRRAPSRPEAHQRHARHSSRSVRSPSTMVDSLRAHEPSRRALARLERLRLSVDLDQAVVVDALVGAIEREERHVRLPKRAAVFPLIVEAPRRLTEILLAGVR